MWLQLVSDWLVVCSGTVKRSGLVQWVDFGVRSGFCGSEQLNPLG